jgi:predicted nucleic acid-binding protein
MSLFVDTSIWYAAADASDRSNARAKAILSSGDALVTTDHVLIETWTLLRHRIQRGAAERFWQGLRSGVAMIEPVCLADLETAWQMGIS